jgi:putative FmdB family regulatory protein
MPIYEYRCEQGHTFEVMQSFSDDPVAECQTCSLPVEKVFHPVAVHFKGKGFYNTDYGKRKRSKDGKESAEGASASEGAASDKSSDKASGSSSNGSGESAAKSKSETAGSSSSSKAASD